MKIKTVTAAVIILLITAFSTSFSAIDQTYVERILKENRDFIDFIDLGVTNFSQDKKNDLFNIYQKHFNAEVAFLQGDYKRAFDSVYDSQKDMVILYEHLLTELYLEDSKNILDNIAPVIIKSKDPIARQYLTLGYRDRTLARTDYMVGEASHPRLYSYKIFKYVDAINMARRAKRYGFIAIYTSQTAAGKLKIYNQLFKTENEKGSPFFKRFVDKNEQDYIREMNKTYEEYEKEIEGSAGGDTQAAAAKTDAAGTESVKTAVKETAFEGKVARGVRFRKEQRVAQYLLNGEFDKAEPIMRSYVENYNFKLITATLNTLSQSHTGEGEPAQKQDYAKLIEHHNDNYLIYNSKSVLESMIGDVRVIDDVNKKGEKQETYKKEVAADDIKAIETEKKTEPENKPGTESKSEPVNKPQ